MAIAAVVQPRRMAVTRKRGAPRGGLPFIGDGASGQELPVPPLPVMPVVVVEEPVPVPVVVVWE